MLFLIFLTIIGVASIVLVIRGMARAARDEFQAPYLDANSTPPARRLPPTLNNNQ